MIRLHIAPALGTVELQKLDGSRIDAFYTRLAKAGRVDGKGGLSPQTCRHIHRLLGQILGSAVKAGKLRTSPMAAVQTAPKVKRADIQVLDDDELTALFASLEGKPLYMPVLVAASTGLRRSEVLALRWSDIDIDKATLAVAQVVELVGWAVTLKEPKTDHSRRTVILPAQLVSGLRLTARPRRSIA